MTYKNISYGSRDEGADESVKKAQQMLNRIGNYQLEEDGIFGEKTQNAVKDYQKANSLLVDGVVGEKTWASLLAKEQTHPVTGNAGASTTPPAIKEDVPSYTETLPPIKEVTSSYGGTSQLPSYADYAARLEDLYDAWSGRGPFSYEAAEDPLYQQYKELYTRQGQLAMQDTMGQAAALTGGYGNSYAQSVGQLAFQDYMQRLSGVIPELYGAAYDRYNARGDQLLQQYELTADMADAAYTRQKAEEDAAYARQKAEEDAAYARQKDNYNRLTALLPYGYSPTDEELTAAGMTRPQADAMINYYKAQSVSTTGSSNKTGSDSGFENRLTGEQVKQLQGWLNEHGGDLTVDGVYGSQTGGAVERQLGSDYDARKAYALLQSVSQVRTLQEAQELLRSKGISYNLATQKEWLDHKKQEGAEGTYQQYLRRQLLELLK